jgi:hypothetical protein
LGRFLQLGLRIAALEIDDLRRRVAILHSKFLKIVIVAKSKECNVTSNVSSPDDGQMPPTGSTRDFPLGGHNKGIRQVMQEDRPFE